MALVTRILTNDGSPLYHPDGSILSNAKVKFTLVDSVDIETDTFDVSGSRVVGSVTAVTDITGTFSVSLWPNDRGIDPTWYLCQVDDGVDFSSVVPSGGGSLSWMDFKLNGSPITPQPLMYGTATLVAGSVTVLNTNMTANSLILFSVQEAGTMTGMLRVSARIIGTSFTVSSSSITDTCKIAYEIFEPV